MAKSERTSQQYQWYQATHIHTLIIKRAYIYIGINAKHSAQKKLVGGFNPLEKY